MEDVIEAIVAEDTSAQEPGTNHRDMNAALINLEISGFKMALHYRQFG